MSTDPIIALDAMGGDQMPRAAVEGALEASRRGLSVILVGDETKLRGELSDLGGTLPIRHAPDVMGMEDQASDVRRRRQSSVMVGMELVRAGEVAGFVSLGHSGATMAAALLVLGRLEGVERPAIVANIPTGEGATALIDAGANADCRPVHLQQFAVMGSLYAQVYYRKPDPTVGLMSIGEEPKKGNELTREAHALLAATPGINFFGNVEGRDLLFGKTDVVVTDGFTGNVVLKLAEGEARAIFSWIRKAVLATPLTRLAGAVLRPGLLRIRSRLDPAEYGAIPLLGVDGYAFIGHGSSDAKAVVSALRSAAYAMEQDLLGRIREGLKQLADVPAGN